jgi:hypothetical protein
MLRFQGVQKTPTISMQLECAFGVWTHRWTILRSPIPMGVSTKKTVALVIALAKLHNDCIDCDDAIVSSSASDEW